jgi:hypothetical protein
MAFSFLIACLVHRYGAVVRKIGVRHCCDKPTIYFQTGKET